MPVFPLAFFRAGLGKIGQVENRVGEKSSIRCRTIWRAAAKFKILSRMADPGTTSRPWSLLISRAPIKRRVDGVLAYMETRLSNWVIESIDGLRHFARRIVRSCRNFEYCRLSAHRTAGRSNRLTTKAITFP